MSRTVFPRESGPSCSGRRAHQGIAPTIWLLLLGATLGLTSASAQTPNFETKFNRPTDRKFIQPTSPVLFVAQQEVHYTDTTYPIPGCGHGDGVCTTCNCTTREVGNYNLGTDVLTATKPSAGSVLYIYLPTSGSVVRLFPRTNHGPPLIDFSPSVGSVVEPSISADGRRVYFSYFQDATRLTQGPPNPASDPYAVKSGADMYWIDISPLLGNPPNPDLVASTLPTRRLTTRTYTCVGCADQAQADRDKDALNPSAANTGYSENQYGTVYLHPTEVLTRAGVRLAYVSNKRRVNNSNSEMQRSNYNLNLFLAELTSGGDLGPEDNQFQYFTTTSVMSPTPLREGLAVSYQGSTEDARTWQIQALSSEGKWKPLIGYGVNPELFHLASFCVGEVQGVRKDYLVATRYYNSNNQGFGALWKQDLSILGTNTYHTPANLVNNDFYVPQQVGSALLSLGARSDDGLSWRPAGTNGIYNGKATTPRCGGVNELYFTFTPTSANSRDFDCECNKSIYRGYIALRRSLEPWNVTDVGPLPGNLEGHFIVVRADGYNLMWPTPVVPMSTRLGGQTQQSVSAKSVVVNQTHVLPGEPFAQLGTSALDNTDRRPYECWLKQPTSGERWYSPWGSPGGDINNQNDSIYNNQDGWTVVPPNNPIDFCKAPPRSGILGVEVNVTSNKTNLEYTTGTNAPYVTDASPYPRPREAKRVLGVYDVRSQSDTSFRTLIPAKVPFELQLIDSAYGMKLADVRGWHSLQARELRADCGGCHQHEDGKAPVPWIPTVASSSVPADWVRGVAPVQKKLGYDSYCNPTMKATAEVSEELPEWHEVFQGMEAYCASCHTTQGVGVPTGRAALAWDATSLTRERDVYEMIQARRFASSNRGALASQLFWAARGKRTDGRSNTAYPATYSLGVCPNGNGTSDDCRNRWGFSYNAAHDVFDTRKCQLGNPAYAEWLFKLGKWIDNNMPRDPNPAPAGSPPTGWKADWYHPTADVAITAVNCAATQMRVGWWDESNHMRSVVVKLGSTVIYNHGGTDFANGSALINGIVGATPSSIVTVEVADMSGGVSASGNRQIYKKRIDQMQTECNLPLVPDPVPQP